MPDESVIVTMAAHAVGISRDHYLVTRTREQFTQDAHSIMKSSLLTVEVVAAMFAGEGGGAAQSGAMPDPYDQVRNAEFPEGSHLQKAGPEMTDSKAAEWARRSVKSSKPYSWYKRSPHRNYNVVNLDTRDPKAFNAGIRKFGER